MSSFRIGSWSNAEDFLSVLVLPVQAIMSSTSGEEVDLVCSGVRSKRLKPSVLS